MSPAQAPEENIVTCGCYLDQACADPTNRCNCDSNDSGVWRKDEGYLTYKDDLPVTQFCAGDTGTISTVYSSQKVTIETGCNSVAIDRQ